MVSAEAAVRGLGHACNAECRHGRVAKALVRVWGVAAAEAPHCRGVEGWAPLPISSCWEACTLALWRRRCGEEEGPLSSFFSFALLLQCCYCSGYCCLGLTLSTI